MLNTQIQLDFNSFHNTISSVGSELQKFESDAKSQDEQVLEVFKKHSELAWFEVQSYLPDMNEVSLKRSITNLKNKGKLEKTKELVMGIYGKQTHKYKLCQQ